MGDSSIRPSRRLSLLQRAQRLRKHVKIVANNKIRRLPEINFINAPVVGSNSYSVELKQIFNNILYVFKLYKKYFSD